MTARGDDWRELLASYTRIMDRVVPTSPPCRNDHRDPQLSRKQQGHVAGRDELRADGGCAFPSNSARLLLSRIRHAEVWRFHATAAYARKAPRFARPHFDEGSRPRGRRHLEKRRIDEAAKFRAARALEPEPTMCGFSPAYSGHPLYTQDDQNLEARTPRHSSHRGMGFGVIPGQRRASAPRRRVSSWRQHDKSDNPGRYVHACSHDLYLNRLRLPMSKMPRMCS